MAKAKRPIFAFPELDSRGRRAILRTVEEVSAELEVLEQQSTDDTSMDIERVKVTYRFRPDAVEAVEDIRRILRRHHGVRKVNREDIAEEAVIEALKQLEEFGANWARGGFPGSAEDRDRNWKYWEAMMQQAQSLPYLVGLDHVMI